MLIYNNSNFSSNHNINIRIRILINKINKFNKISKKFLINKTKIPSKIIKLFF